MAYTRANSEESTGFLDTEKHNAISPSYDYGSSGRLKRATPWIITAVVSCLFLIQTAYLVYRSQPDWHGFRTDFPFSHSTTRMEERRFYWGLHFHENGTVYADINADEPQYVGPPSPEIDEAWENLIGDRFFALTEEEVEEVRKQDALHRFDPIAFTSSPEKFYGEFSWMHDLHCLNHLRMHLDQEHYGSHMSHELPEPLRELHKYHCVDLLRQSIMCHGDTTLIPLQLVTLDQEQYVGKDVPQAAILGHTGRLHTCRNNLPAQQIVKDRKYW